VLLRIRRLWVIGRNRRDIAEHNDSEVRWCNKHPAFWSLAKYEMYHLSPVQQPKVP
jgi:hypothetical protein